MAEPDFDTMRVLVADDEPRVRMLVAECARSLGSQVIEAGDGGEAWELAQSRLPDLVVLDVMMPKMSGWEVCRRIKTTGKTRRGTPPMVIMLTGIGEHLNEMTSPLFAADDWLDKPFALAELSEKLIRLGRKSLVEPPAAPPSGPDLRKARPGSDPPSCDCHGPAADTSAPVVPRSPRRQPVVESPAARPEVKPAKAKVKPSKPAKAKVKPSKLAEAKAKPGKQTKAKPGKSAKVEVKPAKVKAKPAKAKAKPAKAKAKPAEAKVKPSKPAKVKPAEAKVKPSKPPRSTGKAKARPKAKTVAESTRRR